MTRILVAEDEPGIAIGLEDDLRLEGWEVELVTDGATAARRAREVPFDLILLDVMLPGKDGFEVCRELRKAGIAAPIIMLTARSQEAEKVLGLDLGADDYVTKPFSPMELRARIRAALRRGNGLDTGRQATTDIHRFGELEIDLARYELRKAGVVVETTPTEFKLLSAFVRHRGRVLSRQRLLDEVWGAETFVTDRVIDNHIMALRRKIEHDPARPRYLLSARGFGYRFDG